MSANSVSYNDQGSVESGVDAAQENSNIPVSISSGGAAFSLFSADYKKCWFSVIADGGMDSSFSNARSFFGQLSRSEENLREFSFQSMIEVNYCDLAGLSALMDLIVVLYTCKMNGGLGSLRLEAAGVMRNALVSAENLQLTLKSDFSSEEQALTNNHKSGNEEKSSRGNEDLKEMLESSKESNLLKLQFEILLKKLVYVYLVRYAEEQQDLALLSISTFQRALKDPNQLIRASALRVLSSIRVPIIVPIMMLAIKEASTDLSPYVRKTAAHAIQKLYSLDPDQKEHLIEVIEKLLKDKSTVLSSSRDSRALLMSVVMAFEEVCPDRIDLIHKNYRKLCNLLVDVEEWGQVVIIHMLTRYARTQFVSPWREDAVFDENSEKAFYDSEEEKRVDQSKLYIMDPDHRLLLRNTKPLLQSRNTAVVMAVSQLYWHLAPKHELSIITKSLVRLLRSHREVQYIVLQNIATMSIQRKGMFEPFMKSFYVRSTDATHIKTLKLEILTNLANEANISTILREFQAIGRCATNISEVTDTCLNGLVLLLSNRDETVVAESVVVIKKLLQTQPSQHSDIIKHMAKLFDNITVPMARASILWLMGEYCEHVPKIAPDVLRKMAKSFTNEEDIVKLQTVNLAAKLYLTNSKQTKLLTQYILNLGKYDQNYDIRDRTRFIRQLIVPNEKSGALSKYARRILMAPKPAPVLQSAFKDTRMDGWMDSGLAQRMRSASGYLELSDWPAVAPDQSVRNVEVVEPVKEAGAPALGESKPAKSDEKFYSDSEEEEEEEEEEGSSSEDSSSSSSEESESESESEENSDDSNKSSSSQSEKSSSESDSEKKKKTLKNKKLQQQKPDSKDRKQKNGNTVKGESESESGSESSSSGSSSESGSESGSELDSDSDSGTDQKKNTKSKPVQSKPVTKYDGSFLSRESPVSGREGYQESEREGEMSD
ncbi:AP-3 complex subunit beta-1 [Labeo rohita]|uniref:AP-3 complex subunit beta-1 n=1 Tax=Labeo rohita TaxID=84645 RepID=A0ABQ8LNV8_LABRO|nr:AP-3 complex subunit beta-1 [Labeo rohita]